MISRPQVSIPSKVRPKQTVEAEHHNAIIDALTRIVHLLLSLRILSSADIGVRHSSAHSGTLLYLKRRLASGSAAASSACNFGEIVTWDEAGVAKSGIRGGLITCGDQNWAVDNLEIPTASDGQWLASLAIACESNRDDDDLLILPGVLTGTKPTALTLTAYSGSEDYPDTVNPTVSDGLGTAVAALGVVTVSGGVATLVPTACGNITVNQCGGNLSIARG